MQKGFLLCLIGVSMIFVVFCALPTSQSNLQNEEPGTAALTADQFWSQTLPVLECLPLTLTINESKTQVEQGCNLTIRDVSFKSLNFWGASCDNLTIRGYVILPDNTSGRLNGQVPGAVLMHGLFQSTNDTLPWALNYAARDYIVLCYDHPGHGRSDGPAPNSTNFFGPSLVGHYNETAHLYLSNCATLQAIRILREQAGVNQSQIVAGGVSYGGTNAMIASGVYHDKVNATINWIAAGDTLSSWQIEGKLMKYVLGPSTSEAEAAYTELKGVWDPISYVSQPTFPPMLMLFGTNDEFNTMLAFNNTFTAAKSSQRAISIIPNGVHEYVRNYSAQFYWLNATLVGGSPVPRASVDSASIVDGMLGKSASVSFTITAGVAEVSKVELVYAHVDLVGPFWDSIEAAPIQPNEYIVEIPSPPLNSRAGFFVRVTTKSGAVFTTPIYQADLTTWATPLVWVAICLGIAAPICFCLWWRHKRLAQVKRTLNSGAFLDARRKTIVDFTLVGIHGLFLLLVFALPWVSIGDGCSVTGLFILNNFVPPLGQMLASLVLVLTAASFILTFWSPFIGFLLDIIYLNLFSQVWEKMTESLAEFAPGFGEILPGPAFQLMCLSLGLTFSVGLFRLYYWRPVRRASGLGFIRSGRSASQPRS